MKKLKGFAWMKKYKPDMFYKFCKDQSIRSKLMHKNHPEIAKRLVDYANSHPEIRLKVHEWGKLHPEHYKRINMIARQKHPEIRYAAANWVKQHPEHASRCGKITHQKYPNLHRDVALKLNKDRPELGLRLVEYGKKHPECRKGIIQWSKDHPEHCRAIGIMVNKKYPNLRREVGIKSALKQMKGGFMSNQEKIMRNLLPNDFVHNQPLGRIGIPDFQSAERKIVIQVDGVYWHSNEKAKKRDATQTKYWERMGYQVFRFTDIDVNEYLKPIMEQK